MRDERPPAWVRRPTRCRRRPVPGTRPAPRWAPRKVASVVTSAAREVVRASDSTESPYPDLISRVVVPARCASTSRRSSDALSGLPARRPGGLGGGPDPAAVVGLAGHAPGELLGPLAGEDQVGVGVDESRAARTARRRRGARPPGRRPRPMAMPPDRSSTTTDAFSTIPSGPSPRSGTLVINSADVVDDERHEVINFGMMDLELGCGVDRDMRPADHHRPSAHHQVVHIGARGGEDRRGQGIGRRRRRPGAPSRDRWW